VGWFYLQYFTIFFIFIEIILKMEQPLSSRQIQKLIFLPINDIILTDSEYVGPIYKTVDRDMWYLKPIWTRIIHWKSYKNRMVEVLDPHNENNFRGSIWKAVEKCKEAGYKIILFPEQKTNFNSDELIQGLNQLQKNEVIYDYLKGNNINDFKEAIIKYDINPHNSYIFSRKPEVLTHVLEYFLPINKLYLQDKLSPSPLGFNLVLWETATDNSYSIPNLISSTKELPSFLGDIAHKEIHIYASKHFRLFEDKIIYIEDSLNETINNYILDNYNWLLEQASKKGCCFVYLPKIVESKNLTKFISDYLNYHYPQIQFSGRHKLSADLLTSKLLEFLNLPGFKIPALLRNRGSIYNTNPNEYSFYVLKSTTSINTQFENYFNGIQPANDTSEVRFRLVEENDKKYDSEDLVDIPAKLSADELFDENAHKLSEEVIKKIEYLKKEGQYSLLAEIALRLFEGNENKLLKHVSSRQAFPKIKSSEPGKLQIEWTSKYNFQIYLPDYGNMIVEMPRLPKALYYFFLKHPEGVMLNNLADFKEEILSIYSRISNFSDKNEIEENINRLTDPFDNSVNVNCSRIKNAFVKLIDDDLAKYYYITGERGQAKKITLPINLIRIINNY